MKIYMTKRNADMTEGRGPMVKDLCFSKRVFAEQYIDTKSGVMGRKAKWSAMEYGDWEIEEIDVLEYSIVDAEEERKKIAANAMSKLDDREIEALGLSRLQQ